MDAASVYPPFGQDQTGKWGWYGSTHLHSESCWLNALKSGSGFRGEPNNPEQSR